MLKQFNFASLSEFDSGRLREAIDHALDQVRRDLIDRPNLKGKRGVAVMLTMSPRCVDGILDTIKFDFELKTSLPKRAVEGYSLMPTKGGLVFQEHSPEDARQMALDDVPAPRAVSVTVTKENAAQLAELGENPKRKKKAVNDGR